MIWKLILNCEWPKCRNCIPYILVNFISFSLPLMMDFIQPSATGMTKLTCWTYCWVYIQDTHLALLNRVVNGFKLCSIKVSIKFSKLQIFPSLNVCLHVFTGIKKVTLSMFLALTRGSWSILKWGKNHTCK